MSSAPDPQDQTATTLHLWQRRRYQVAAAAGVALLASAALMAPRIGLMGRTTALPRGAGGQSAVGPLLPGAQGAGIGAASAGPSAGSGAGSGGGPAGRHTPRRGPQGGTAGTKGKPTKPADPGITTTVDVAGVTATVTDSGSMPAEHHTMRVVSARANLAGQRELAWAADAGHRVGDAWCTQNFRFNPSEPARVRPTLLLCWHTSPTKTVYTVAVDVDHRPSEKASVALIDQVWAALG